MKEKILIIKSKNLSSFENEYVEKVILNKYGQIVQDIWAKLPQRYDNIELDEYIIMPNHIHGIVIIKKERAQASSAPTNFINPFFIIFLAIKVLS